MKPCSASQHCMNGAERDKSVISVPGRDRQDKESEMIFGIESKASLVYMRLSQVFVCLFLIKRKKKAQTLVS